jgi:hypothetical protein
MRFLCQPCWDRGRRRPATNLDAVKEYGSVLRCDDCNDAAGEDRDERDFAAFHGGSSWGDSGQMERAARDGAWRR